MKTVGLTYDLKTDYVFKDGDPQDANAEFDSSSTVEVVVNAIEANGYKIKRIGNIKKLLEEIDNLGVDIVFNISEGYEGRNRESQVPIFLELYNIPFVGSDALTLGITLDKIIAKKIFISEGINTPKFFEVRSLNNLNTILNTNHRTFPMIVKPRFEGSSKGLSSNSRVKNEKELKRQVELIINTYKQPALVEEFITGQEFTVAIVGNDPPEVFPVVQVEIDGRVELGEEFYTFAHLHSDRLKYLCPASISKELEASIKEQALRTYKAVECRDFGRVDIRVDKEGQLYILEINPLPSLSTEDVFMLISKAIGTTYEKMVGRIIEVALKRYNEGCPHV
ncbi:MAG: ATP-grasp domain-containing protein [Candidatus Omnitrophota bacterium]|nr:ATP-grasp domain-containing protein [Candidatus Omnitrophota bacterium]